MSRAIALALPAPRPLAFRIPLIGWMMGEIARKPGDGLRLAAVNAVLLVAVLCLTISPWVLVWIAMALAPLTLVAIMLMAGGLVD